MTTKSIDLAHVGEQQDEGVSGRVHDLGHQVFFLQLRALNAAPATTLDLEVRR